MRTNGVVKALDVGENGILGVTPGAKMRQMDQLAFQTAQEVFRNSIVVWISLPGHALTNAAFDQFVPVSFGSILHASVTVKNQAAQGCARATAQQAAGIGPTAYARTVSNSRKAERLTLTPKA